MTTGSQEFSWCLGSESDLFRFVGQELQNGFGFVPVFGAGVSDDSGVPLIWELEKYLSHCVLQALGLRKMDGVGLRNWDPREDRWPPVAETLVNTPTSEIPDEVIAAAIKKERESSTSQRSPRLALLQEASGAIAEWRSSLLFLSRLRSSSSGKTWLGVPDDEVIDRFFRNSTTGRRAGLIHKMLTQLALPMRFQSLLTTNFDELTEEAFTEANEPLDVFEVPRGASLPSISFEQERRLLVKLHGGRYGLRGDYSLDADPSAQEIRNFASFFAGTPIKSDKENARRHFTWANHALVLGLSGHDHRIIQLLKNAVERSKGKMRIVWIGFSEQSYDGVRRAFGALREQCKYTGSQKPQLLTVRTRHLGLMLLRLFQSLTLALPPRFAVFPSASRLRIPPAVYTPDRREALSSLVYPSNGNDAPGQQIETCAARARDAHRRGSGDPNIARACLLGGGPQIRGLTSRAIYHFNRAASKGHADRSIWLSLENISSTDELFEQLTDAIARAAGQFEWSPIVLFDRQEKRIAEIDRLTRGSKRWVIFLDARDGAGTARGTGERTKGNWPNGWLDFDSIRDDSPSVTQGRKPDELDETSANSRDFVELLKGLTVRGNSNLSIVLIYHNRLDSGELTPLQVELQNELVFRQCLIDMEQTEPGQIYPFAEYVPAGKNVSHLKPTPEQKDFSHESAAESAIQWVDEPNTLEAQRERAYFLLGLVCCQRHRYPSLLLSNSFAPPRRDAEARNVDDPTWLEHRSAVVFGKNGFLPALSGGKRCVVRETAGGFVWMHSQTRSWLRAGSDEANWPRITTSIESESFATMSPDDLLTGVWGDERYFSAAGPLAERFGLPVRFAVFRAQFLIGRWYLRLMRSSQAPLAGIEAMGHLLRAATNAAEVLSSPSGDYEWPNDSKFLRFNSGEANVPSNSRSQLLGAINAACQAATEIKPLAISTGQPKATCRAIVHLRVALIAPLRHALCSLLKRPDWQKHGDWRLDVDSAVRRLDDLTLNCARMLRGIAREVSEHTRAFFRHRQVAEFLFLREIEFNSAMPGEPHPTKNDATPGNVCDEISQVTQRVTAACSRKHRSRLWTHRALERAERADLLREFGKQGYNVDLAAVRRLHTEHVRWRRHGGILALATRAYPRSAREFAHSLRIAVQSIIDPKAAAEPPPQSGNPATDALSRGLSMWETFEQQTKSDCPDFWRLNQRTQYKFSLSTPTVSFPESHPLTIHLATRQLLSDAVEHVYQQLNSAVLAHTNSEDVLQILKGLCRVVQWYIVAAESVLFVSVEKAEEVIRHQDCCAAKRCFEVFYHVLRCYSKSTPAFSGAQQMMETQMSTIFGLDNEWHRAHRCLDTATELQSPGSAHSLPLSMGVIELHRSQLFLLHARSASANGICVSPVVKSRLRSTIAQTTSMPGSHTSTRKKQHLAEVCISVLLQDDLDRLTSELKRRQSKFRNLEEARIPVISEEIMQKLGIHQHDTAIQSANALIEDAAASARRAERILIEKRKNVWWSTWLFELKAKAIEYRLLLQLEKARLDLLRACVHATIKDVRAGEAIRSLHERVLLYFLGRQWFGEDDSPRHAPDFGVPDAPRGLDMELDRLMSQTQRMVRLDMIRPARVLETYAHCTWGLEVLLLLDSRCDRLPSRQKKMISTLIAARGDVEVRWKKRQTLPPSPAPYVGAYVESVLNMSQDIIDELS